MGMELTELKQGLKKGMPKERAYRLAAIAVIAYHLSYRIEEIIGEYDNVRISRAALVIDSMHPAADRLIVLAAPVAACVLKGNRKLDKSDEERMIRWIERDFGNEDGVRKAETEKELKRLFSVAVDLVRQPANWGKITALAQRLMQKSHMKHEEVEKVIDSAYPDVPEKKVVYDW